MEESRIRKSVKSFRLSEILYTVCIGYMMITHILHSVTQLPYTGITLLLILAGVDAYVCRYIYISKRNLFVFMFYGIGIVISVFYMGNSKALSYAMDFICFAPVAAYISEYNLDFEGNQRVIRNLAVIFIAFYVLGFMRTSMETDYFNTSACILPGLLSLFDYTWNKVRQRRYALGGACLVILVCASFEFLLLCSRSAVVSYICFCVVFALFKDVPKWVKICGVGLLAAGIYIAFHMRKFVRWGYRILKAANIDVLFFTKSIDKLNTSTIASHREDLYSSFLRSDFLTFIFGNGVGGFEEQFGTYAHNVILQKWSDFGIIGLIWILFVMVMVFVALIKDGTNRDIFLIILGSTIFPLMFSFTYWLYPCFYLLEFLSLRYYVSLRKVGKRADVYTKNKFSIYGTE